MFGRGAIPRVFVLASLMSNEVANFALQRFGRVQKRRGRDLPGLLHGEARVICNEADLDPFAMLHFREPKDVATLVNALYPAAL